MNYIFGLRLSRNPRNHQFSQHMHVRGRSRSLTLDDLRKVSIQYHRFNVIVMFCPKSLIMSPSQSMATSYVAENAISVKNQSAVAQRMTS